MDIDSFLADLKTTTSQENLSSLVQVVDLSAKLGWLSSLPEEKSQVITHAYIAARLSTVRSRLFLLGYLDKECVDHTLGQHTHYVDDKARQAIRKFQGDAGLTVDGWVGPETWKALEELVSFEYPTDVSAWLAKKPRMQRAMWCAVGLRLSVLGLPAEPSGDLSKLVPGLHAFVQVAQLLQLADTSLSENDLQQVLNLLFSQDILVERLSRFKGKFPYDTTISQPIEINNLARRFVTCVARIELWLLGIKINLKANSDYQNKLKDLHPSAALFDFWRLQGNDVNSARQLSNQELDGSFFQALRVSTTATSDLQDQTNFTDWLFKRLSRENSGLRKPLWDTIQELGSRIWDGLQRVWNLVKDRFMSITKITTTWVRNLARLTHKLALKAFETVQIVLKRLDEAIRFSLPGILPKSHIPNFFILADRDLDYVLFVEKSAQIPELKNLAIEMHHHARDFSTAMKILTTLLKALIYTLAIPGVGWFKFFLALVRSASQISLAMRNQ